MQAINGSYDVMWTTVTMDDGVVVAIGGGWNLPPSYPNYCATWIEITGTKGALSSMTASAINCSTRSRRERALPCRRCRASRWTTSLPARWDRRRCIFLNP